MPTTANAGSSPRVRGTEPFEPELGQRLRFIPACAGNGSLLSGAPAAVTVHPRVCGERPCAACGAPLAIGSSPRVRGTVREQGHRHRRVRFIPACAGNGVAGRRFHPFLPVHPRVCGERTRAHKRAWSCSGSSPRVRGTACDIDRAHGRGRFIPACAGNGLLSRWRPSPASVHPRVCGERDGLDLPHLVPDGSSPRVRGTAARFRSWRPCKRFIPACAGNGLAVGGPATCRPVHPRVCGERGDGLAVDRVAHGSSPRVRGTDALGCGWGALRRFIPACAGNGPWGEDLGVA